MNTDSSTPASSRALQSNGRAKGWRTLAGASVALVIAGLIIYSALADVPQPVLRISDLGSNVYSILITNGVSTTNYTLFSTPALENPVYPWQVWTIGDVGVTNFTFTGGVYSVLFFRGMIGDDFDGDGVPEWKDGQPFNPSVGALRITIDSPANGFNFN